MVPFGAAKSSDLSPQNLHKTKLTECLHRSNFLQPLCGEMLVLTLAWGLRNASESLTLKRSIAIWRLKSGPTRRNMAPRCPHEPAWGPLWPAKSLRVPLRSVCGSILLDFIHISIRLYSNFDSWKAISQALSLIHI